MKHLKKFEYKKETNSISVVNDSYTEVTRKADPDDNLVANDTYTNNNIIGIKIDSKYYDINAIPFEILPDKDYYLLYVIYSTGDSFSHHEGRIDYVELYDDESLAEKSAKMIEDDYKDWRKKEDKWNVNILNSSGKIFQFYCPWKGHFEGLTSVEVENVRLIK
mgnify:CR=1 FL=1